MVDVLLDLVAGAFATLGGLVGEDKSVKHPIDPNCVVKDGDVLVEINDLEVKFSVRNRFLTAIRKISLQINKGDILAIVGESASGKSVFTKCLTGMLDANGSITNGTINYMGADLAQFNCIGDWLQIRGKRISTVFQDPMTSLNPLRRIGGQIAEVVKLHRSLPKKVVELVLHSVDDKYAADLENAADANAKKAVEKKITDERRDLFNQLAERYPGLTNATAKAEAIRLLKKVGIKDAEKRYRDYPFQYSGGMRQRVVIAIALACAPDILICDEPTTALDVTIQAQILDLIIELKKEFGFTVLFITHDLGVVAEIADKVAVMYAGQIIEYGTVNDIFYDPRHPYTWALLSSLPQLGEKGENLYSITGTPPSLFNEVKGDAFAPRNPYALKVDFVEEPPMFKISDTHFAKTWLCDPRAPKVERPKIINEITERVAKIYSGGMKNGK